MTEITTTPEHRPYARFAKRDLEKMSWIAPLLNNPLGDALNLEVRHEQLFFIQGDQVFDDVGYSETGKRFCEADFGKAIRTLEDLHKAGYFLSGRIYAPEVMREALSRQQDGYYYSFFSNQCQDWVDRLKRQARRVEREWGLEPGQLLEGGAPGIVVKPARTTWVPPTEPASVAMGAAAIVLGIAAMYAPTFSAVSFTILLGLFFGATGISNAVYAFHGRDVRSAVPIMFFAIQYLIAAALFLANTSMAVMGIGVLIAAVLAVHGISKLAVGIFSRPIRNWSGTLGAGFIMITCALMVYLGWPASSERFLGVFVGVCLIAGGASTIYLSQRTRSDEN